MAEVDEQEMLIVSFRAQDTSHNVTNDGKRINSKKGADLIINGTGSHPC